MIRFYKTDNLSSSCAIIITASQSDVRSRKIADEIIKVVLRSRPNFNWTAIANHE